MEELYRERERILTSVSLEEYKENEGNLAAGRQILNGNGALQEMGVIHITRTKSRNLTRGEEGRAVLK